jgi:hypothetical protein
VILLMAVQDSERRPWRGSGDHPVRAPAAAAGLPSPLYQTPSPAPRADSVFLFIVLAVPLIPAGALLLQGHRRPGTAETTAAASASKRAVNALNPNT